MYAGVQPWIIGLSIGFLALILEEAALLLSIAIVSSMIAPLWPVAIGLYAGIVAGDMLLYGAGRWLLSWRWFAKFMARRKIKLMKRSAGWKVNNKSWFMIAIARAIPASRLPTFVAAGMLKTSILPFTIIILSSAFLWVGLALLGGMNALQLFELSFGIPPYWLFAPVLLMWGLYLAFKSGFVLQPAPAKVRKP